MFVIILVETGMDVVSLLVRVENEILSLIMTLLGLKYHKSSKNSFSFCFAFV